MQSLSEEARLVSQKIEDWEKELNLTQELKESQSSLLRRLDQLIQEKYYLKREVQVLTNSVKYTQKAAKYLSDKFAPSFDAQPQKQHNLARNASDFKSEAFVRASLRFRKLVHVIVAANRLLKGFGANYLGSKCNIGASLAGFAQS